MTLEPGRALLVDLAAGGYRRIVLPGEVMRAYIGGSGLATCLLARFAPPGVDPLSPANPVVIAAAPLDVLDLPGGAPAAMAAKSPLTGMVGDSMVTGQLGAALRSQGLVALVVTGSRPETGALVVESGRPAWLPAPGLAGLTAGRAAARLGLRPPEGWAVAATGPAGERQVLYASVEHGGHHAGRTGLGAVFGVKRMKALAIRRQACGAGPALPELAQAVDSLRNAAAAKSASGRGPAGESPARRRVREGIVPGRNFRCTWEADPGSAGAGSLAYEPWFALGPNLGIAEPAAIAALSRSCDDFGIDCITAGGALAWAMESLERGVRLPGIDGPAGRPDAAELAAGLLEALAGGKPAGELLGLGSRAAARRTGGGSAAWAMHVKGLELPGYEPRALPAHALGIAVNPRGACHTRSTAYDWDPGEGSPADPLAVAAAVRDGERRAALLDSLTVDRSLRRCFVDFRADSARLLSAAAGVEFSAGDLDDAANRILNLRKAFNEREGWTPADDDLPDRLFDEPLRTGPHAGSRLDRAWLRDSCGRYYRLCGWDAQGRLAPAQVADLRLDADLPTEAAGPLERYMDRGA